MMAIIRGPAASAAPRLLETPPRLTKNRTPPPPASGCSGCGRWHVRGRGEGKSWGGLDPAIAGHPHLKHCTGIMSLEEEIKAHTRRVESGERVCFCKACPACAAQAGFKPHYCRRRTFRVLIDDMVKCLRSWILRWKCPNCGRRFTDYPPFRASAQTLHQADRLRQIQGLLGPGCFVSRCRAASRATHLSRPRQTVERVAGGPRLVRFGAQHTMALALLAG
jgi:hypothetical protein